MPISVSCHCGHQFRVRDEYAGKKAQCPHCGDPVVIPTASGPPAAFEEAPDEFPQFAAAPAASPAKRRAPSGQWFAGMNSGLFGLGRLSGLACLLIGLIFVLMARGCDSLANRYSARYAADYELAQNEFQQIWDEKKYKVETSIEEIQADIEKAREQMGDPKTTPNERTRFQEDIDRYNEDLRDERDELQDLQTDERKEKREKEVVDWKDIKANARDARAHNAKGRFWRELLFVLGTIVLSVGLLTVGFTGEPHERRICLIMITIITFSIYVGGLAWVETLISTATSTTRGLR